MKDEIVAGIVAAPRLEQFLKQGNKLREVYLQSKLLSDCLIVFLVVKRNELKEEVFFGPDFDTEGKWLIDTRPVPQIHLSFALTLHWPLPVS